MGAGQTGATAALVFARAGHDVTLYTDRSAQSLFDDTPATGTAHVFGETVATERRLGLPTYEADAPVPRGYSFCVSPEPGQELIHFGASLGRHTGRAVDTRLISADRMDAFSRLGGQTVIETVTPERLDEIAGQNDLTLVCTGKGGLASLFPRDAARSGLGAPARHLLMITVAGIPMDGFSYRTVAPSDAGQICSIANLTGGAGEAFWTPYLHKTAGHTWNLFVEAVPGGPWDRHRRVSTADEALAAVQALVDQYAPWDSKAIGQAEVIASDRCSWLKGEITPSVRAGWGRTASGALVLSFGDTSVAYDPIAGQGANSGIKQVAHYLDAVGSAGDGPLDEAWAEGTWESFHQRHVAPAMRLTNVYLGEYPEALGLVVFGCYADPRVGEALVRLFSEPHWRWPLADNDAAHAFIAEATQEDPAVVIAAGRQRMAAAEADIAIGLPVFPRR